MQSESARFRPARPLYFSLGLLFVGLGYIGYVLPGMPGTIFFILALWAFKRSSPRLEDWLLHRSVIGPVLRDWEYDRSIRPRTKVLILVVMWSSIALSAAMLWQRPSAVWLIPLLVACVVGVSIYILTRKSKV